EETALAHSVVESLEHELEGVLRRVGVAATQAQAAEARSADIRAQMAYDRRVLSTQAMAGEDGMGQARRALEALSASAEERERETRAIAAAVGEQTNQWQMEREELRIKLAETQTLLDAANTTNRDLGAAMLKARQLVEAAVTAEVQARQGAERVAVALAKARKETALWRDRTTLLARSRPSGVCHDAWCQTEGDTPGGSPTNGTPNTDTYSVGVGTDPVYPVHRWTETDPVITISRQTGDDREVDISTPYVEGGMSPREREREMDMLAQDNRELAEENKTLAVKVSEARADARDAEDIYKEREADISELEHRNTKLEAAVEATVSELSSAKARILSLSARERERDAREKEAVAAVEREREALTRERERAERAEKAVETLRLEQQRLFAAYERERGLAQQYKQRGDRLKELRLKEIAEMEIT
ncbi:hypothetical protein KIPB_005276, partial [Kipferlia bialata]